MKQVKDVKVVKVAKVKSDAERTNVELITERLQKIDVSKMDDEFARIVKEIMEIKPSYKAKEHGDKILAKQVKDIYDMTEAGELRFADKWKVDPRTKKFEPLSEEDIQKLKDKAA
jgi:hypothetical protein